MDYTAYIFSSKETVRGALRALQDQGNAILTLFVEGDNGTVIGSLTDGDIRRFLVAGGQLEDNVTLAAQKHFKYLPAENQKEWLPLIREYRKCAIKMIPILDKQHRIIGMYDVMKYPSYVPMDAVLMAGGKGERLRPLTLKIPKSLLPVGNKAIIDHNVDRLIQSGVEHISVTVNYLAEQIEEHYREPHQGVKVQCVREPKFLGTMGAALYVPKFYNDVILVMNSDLFTDIDFEDFYMHFMKNDADMSVAAIPYNVSVPYGIFDLDGRNIVGLQEKPVYNYYANAGIYLIKKSALEFIPKEEHFDATDLIERLVEAHKRVIRYPLNGTWIDIGTMSEYQKANDLAKHL